MKWGTFPITYPFFSVDKKLPKKVGVKGIQKKHLNI